MLTAVQHEFQWKLDAKSLLTLLIESKLNHQADNASNTNICLSLQSKDNS